MRHLTTNEIIPQPTAHTKMLEFDSGQAAEQFKEINPDHTERQRETFLDGRVKVRFSVHTYLIRFLNKPDMDRWLAKSEEKYEVLHKEIPTSEYRLEPGEPYTVPSNARSSYSRSSMVDVFTPEPSKERNYYVVHLGNGGKEISSP